MILVMNLPRFFNWVGGGVPAVVRCCNEQKVLPSHSSKDNLHTGWSSASWS